MPLDPEVECPLCLRFRSASSFALAGPLMEYTDANGHVVQGRARTKKGPRPKVQQVAFDPADQTDVGQLQPIAARVLMKVLYAARTCRFDLMRAACLLAQRITRWDAACDRRLHRLMSYV